MSTICSSSVSVREMTIDQLVEIVNAEVLAIDEQEMVITSAHRSIIPHAIRIGEALIAARDQMDRGSFGSWLRSNFSFSRSSATRYMRMARGLDELQGAGLIDGKVRDVIEFLSTSGTGLIPKGAPDDVKKKALQLHQLGATRKAIASITGVTDGTVSRWVDPQAASKRKKQARLATKARQALARQEREALVRRSAGNAADAYALIRKASLAVDQAIAETSVADERDELQKARTFLHRAEDRLVGALQIARGRG